MHDPNQLILSIDFPVHFVERSVPSPKELVVFLHGYMQIGSYMLSKLGKAFSESSYLLAPSGPFPIPEKSKDGWRLGFSWYFYDPITDEYVVDMKTSIGMLGSLIQSKGFATLPKKIVGFSQGGYLAPFLGQRLKNVSQVICIAGQFLDEELSGELPFQMDAIHGELDEICDPAKAESSVHALLARGLRAKYHEVKGGTHRISESVVESLRSVLQESP
jgi:predicted esterase